VTGATPQVASNGPALHRRGELDCSGPPSGAG